jgi:SAM-dependent methyltransferase
MTVSGAAAATHDALAAAYHVQRAKLAPPEDMWANCAANFKPDFSAPVPPFGERVASFLGAQDVLLDVGGGSGRVSLPIADRCREVICVDPSPAMGEVFETAVREAGIRNARFVLGGWAETPGVAGDVTLVAHVTYFVTDIVSFVRRLNDATRRRVLIGLHSPPPPDLFAPFFKLTRGEEQALVPGRDELLAVLTELGIDAQVIEVGPAPQPVVGAALGASREQTVRGEVEGGVRLGWLQAAETESAAALFLEHFDDLYVDTEQGSRRRVGVGSRELIVTWETGG